MTIEALQQKIKQNEKPLCVALLKRSQQKAATGGVGLLGGPKGGASAYPQAALDRVKSHFVGGMSHFVVKQTTEAIPSKSTPAVGLLAYTAGSKPSSRPSPAARSFPNLGLVVGPVDATGLAHLLKEKAEGFVQTVTSLPVFRWFRPAKPPKPATTSSKITGSLALLDIEFLRSEYLRATEIRRRNGGPEHTVRIGHLDSGVWTGHAAFAGKSFQKYWIDDVGLVDQHRPYADGNDYGHGTHTAGTLIGKDVGGTRIGIMPEADLVSYSVIRDGDTDQTAAGIETMFFRITGGVDHLMGQRCNVACMSIGLGVQTSGDDPVLTTMISDLRAGGCVPVVAIGNSGPGIVCEPGCYPSSLSVGHVDLKNNVSEICSNKAMPHGQVPYVMAPGEDILSAGLGDPHRLHELSGSSMAAPHVAGLMALLSGIFSSAPMATIEEAVKSSCIPLNKPHQGFARYGRVSGRGAYDRLLTRFHVG